MEWLISLFGGGAAEKAVEGVAAYKLADLLLGRHLGAVMMGAAVFLSYKLIGMHRSEASKFSFAAIPGLVVAFVTVAVFLVGLAVLIFGVPNT